MSRSDSDIKEEDDSPVYQVTGSIRVNQTAIGFLQSTTLDDRGRLATENYSNTLIESFHSTNYTKRPRNSEQVPKARICKVLETSGSHEDTLYTDHYGKFPTHCPQWARMDIDEKKKIAMAAKHCLRCFAPNIFVKTKVDTAKHHETECYVYGINRHKFTCLNRTCLLHSWICKDHIEENGPQSETHNM